MDPERRAWDEAEAKRAGTRRGRFVEEQYVEDEDEWEGRSPARMLGCVFLLALFFWIAAGLLVWLYLWPKT